LFCGSASFGKQPDPDILAEIDEYGKKGNEKERREAGKRFQKDPVGLSLRNGSGIMK